MSLYDETLINTKKENDKKLTKRGKIVDKMIFLLSARFMDG